MTDGNPPAASYGVHSEVGKLRKVLVCAPGLAHSPADPVATATSCSSTTCSGSRTPNVITPTSVAQDAGPRRRGRRAARRADRDHQQSRRPGPGCWTAKIIPNEVGLGLVDDTRAFLDTPGPAHRSTEYLIGGLSTIDLPRDFRHDYVRLAREAPGVREYLMPPLPNTLYTRDTTCWIYGGVTLNPLFFAGAARRDPADEGDLPASTPTSSASNVWWGDPERHWGHGHASKAGTSCSVRERHGARGDE